VAVEARAAPAILVELAISGDEIGDADHQEAENPPKTSGLAGQAARALFRHGHAVIVRGFARASNARMVDARTPGRHEPIMAGRVLVVGDAFTGAFTS
jgi:hypothetical protein